MESITITMALEKVTKNALRFAEKTENEFAMEKLGTIYLQKSVFVPGAYTGQDVEITLAIADDESGLTFSAEKATKNTVMFTEDLPSEYALAKIGNIYIPKATLAELGWRPDLKQKIAVAIVTK